MQELANRLYRTALAYLGSVQEAEDAVQDTFVIFYEKSPQNLKNPAAWLTRVLVNQCRDRLRSPQRREVPLWEGLPAPGPEEKEELEELFSLPPEDRTVLHLFYYEGYSTEEIAAILNVRPGTVRARLSRARDRLRTLLKGGAE